MRRTTLSDIAKKCSVSINTVSHALNNKPDISDETKRIIKAAADELGYIHNASASFLRSGISKSIAIIIGDISNPHFSILIKGIETTARKNEYTSFVLNTDENEKLEREAIIAALSKNVDGIIICPVQKTDSNIRFLLSSGVPFVLIGRRFTDIQTNYVVCDDFHSGYIAAQYILERKLSRTAFINAENYISSARERMDGIKKCFAENNREIEDKDIYSVSVSEMRHKRQMSCIANNEYDSAICFNDMLALELLSNSERKIEIVSFDNIQSTFNMPYKFASITSSKTKMSNKAVEILLRCIDGMDNITQIVLPTKLS